jgi:hypothetical protein
MVLKDQPRGNDCLQRHTIDVAPDMEKVLSVLAAVAALSCAAPHGAWAHSPRHSSQTDRTIPGNPPYPPDQARPVSSERNHRDRDDFREYRLFYRERIFQYAGGKVRRSGWYHGGLVAGVESGGSGFVSAFSADDLIFPRRSPWLVA